MQPFRYAVEWYPAKEVEAHAKKYPQDKDDLVRVALEATGPSVEFCSTIEKARKVAATKVPLDFFGCAHITREHKVYVECYGDAVWERDQSFDLEELS